MYEQQSDDLYLNELLSDLFRKLDETPDPRYQVIEMGCFVEVVHHALKECIFKKAPKDKGKSIEKYWEDCIDQHNVTLSSLAITQLSMIYKARNKCAHSPKTDREYKDQQIAIDSVSNYRVQLEKNTKEIVISLKGWRRSDKAPDFLTCLKKHDQRRPHYVWQDRVRIKIKECAHTLSDEKRVKRLIKKLERIVETLGVSLGNYTEDKLEDQLVALCLDIARAHSEQSESNDSLIKYKQKIVKVLEELKKDFEERDRNQIIQPLIGRLKQPETSIRHNQDFDLLRNHLCIHLRYDQAHGVVLKPPQFIPSVKLDRTLLPKQLKELDDVFENLLCENLSRPLSLEELDAWRHKKPIEKRVAHLAKRSAGRLNRILGLESTEIALTILIDTGSYSESNDDYNDDYDDDYSDDYDDDYSDDLNQLRDPLLFDCDFLTYQLAQSRKQPEPMLKVKFESVSLVWTNIAQYPYRRERFVANPFYDPPPKRALSAVYKGHEAFAHNCEENPNAIFGEVNLNKISDSLMVHLPMGALCLIRNNRPDDDLDIEKICENIFESESQLTMNEFMEKLSHLIRTRKFSGQVLLHDPALIKHFFAELKQP